MDLTQSTAPPSARATDREAIAEDLEEARRRTEWLLAPVDDDRLAAQQDKLMSPLVWDAAHVGVQEELWGVMKLSGTDAMREELLHMYDAFENPRAARVDLPLLDRAETSAYRDQVRARVLAILEEADFDGDDPLVRDGFVYKLVIEHEHQHNETILQTLQLLKGGYRPEIPADLRAQPADPAEVLVPAGTYPIGNDGHAPYDNEHPQHQVALRAFLIDRYPVTCGQWLEFMADGGYDRQELWGEAGWKWRQDSGIDRPKTWLADGRPTDAGGWRVDRFGHLEPLRANTPVMHVCWHEADAYARWAGKRLPHEFEWEVAASYDPATGQKHRYPWGEEAPGANLCNIDHLHFGCQPVGAFPAGASAFGCEQMIGDVWEWCSNDFMAYPGYRSFPYKEYSEVFFGDEYKVLRGASWAARPTVARITMRNWDYPIRRQIFAGLRCVRDAES
jgi:iron(II)-dependent oxidoreductase